jgi:4-amino-4-deoxy-L-arabinose transferase-like glycosyltransferase
LIEKYKRSQDITHGVENRVHISDNDIYIASGYLYAKGESPIKYNFQHPPLLKYLFGLSTTITDNPYWVQIVFGAAFITISYYFSFLLFKSRVVAVLAAIFIVFDPAFFEVSTQALLDLGQAVFALSFLVLVLYYPKKYKLQGLVLGLFVASKFWTAAVFFVLLIYGYKLLMKEKLEAIKVLYSFAIAFVVFILFYARAYIEHGRYFDIFFFEAKVVKFMLQHNSSDTWGGSFLLFLTGHFKNWWSAEVVKSSVLTFLWTLSLELSTFKSARKKLSYEHLIYVFPVIYLLLISNQVPFTRYYVIILPFLYISLSKFLWGMFLRINKGYKFAKIPR